MSNLTVNHNNENIIGVISFHAEPNETFRFHYALQSALSSSQNLSSIINNSDINILDPVYTKIIPPIRHDILNISTKYYTTTSTLLTYHLGITPELALLESLTSLFQKFSILIFYAQTRAMFPCKNLINLLSKFPEAEFASTRLLVVETISKTDFNDSDQKILIEWSLDHQFELFYPFELSIPKEARTKSRALLSDDEDDETVSTMDMIASSILCHRWVKIILNEKHGSNQNNSFVISNSSNSTSSNIESSVNIITSCEKKPVINGDSREPDCNIENKTIENIPNEDAQDPIETFEKFAYRIKTIREMALSQTVTDDERRKVACDMAEELAKAFNLM